jgi:hypothetical protein
MNQDAMRGIAARFTVPGSLAGGRRTHDGRMNPEAGMKTGSHDPVRGRVSSFILHFPRARSGTMASKR